MKKFLSFAAFALLCVVTLGALTACDSDEEPGDVPTNQKEAREMLMGQWKAGNGINLLHGSDFNYLEYYYEIKAEGQDYHLIHFAKISGDATGKWKDYAQKYALIDDYKITKIEFADDNYQKGTITYEKGSSTATCGFYELTATTIKFDDEGDFRFGKVKNTINYLIPGE